MKIPMFVLCSVALSACIATPNVVELAELTTPNGVVVDEDAIYIADGHRVLAYSLDPVEFLWEFGEQGEGPGQFQYRARIKRVGDSLLAHDFMKSMWLSKTGELLGQKSFTDFEWFNPGMEMQLSQLGENYVRVTVDHDLDGYYVDVMNAGFEPVTRLLDGHFDWRIASEDSDTLGLMSRLVDVLSYDNKVFIGDAHRGFFFDVFDQSGNHLYSIDKNDEIEPVELYEEYRAADIEFWTNREDMQWLFGSDREFVFAYPEFFSPFHYFQIADDRLFVTTYKMEDGKHEVIVLDLEGNIIERVFLPLESMRYHGRSILPSELYTFGNGRVYELIENSETGVWELQVSELN